MNKQRRLLVVSGPSGAGKDTVIAALIKKHPDIVLSVSATTRKPRMGEADGVNYFFLTHKQFQEKIFRSEMLEYASYCDNYYGTPKSEVDERINNDITVVLVIEVQGAANIKSQYPECTTVFISPPSMDELANRLRGRGTESEDAVEGRLKRAREEMALAENYDYRVVNQQIEKCADDIYEILKERQCH